jgi:hypothetical protein
MWSNLYFYYEIRGNAVYTRCLPTDTVLKVLENTQVLKKSSKQTFLNEDGYPWMDIVVVDSNNGNFGREEHFDSETVNLIAVVGSRQLPDNEKFYMEFLTGIAELLNWEFILECDDEGNEDVLLRAIS